MTEENPMAKPDEAPQPAAVAAPSFLGAAGGPPAPSPAPVTNSTPPLVTQPGNAGAAVPDWMQGDMTNPDQVDYKDEIHRLYIKMGESKDVIFLSDWAVNWEVAKGNDGRYRAIAIINHLRASTPNYLRNK